MITAQICNRQLVVLQTLYNICQISTILDTRTINHDVQFSSTYKFDGAIFLGSTKINQFKYVGNIVMNSNMNMFAFMIIDSFQLSNSVIDISNVRSPFGSLLQHQGGPILNNCTLRFDFVGIGVGGLSFSMITIVVNNCTYEQSITAERGGVLAYSATGLSQIQYFNVTGTFQVPFVYLTQVCNKLYKLEFFEVHIPFKFQNQCGNDNFTGFCTTIPLYSQCEYITITLQQNIKKIQFDGINTSVQCWCNNYIENAYVSLDQLQFSNRDYSKVSIFCAQQTYKRIIVKGDYKLQTSTKSTTYASIFTRPTAENNISIINCSFEVTFKVTNPIPENLIFIVFILNQDFKSIIFTNIRLNITIQTCAQVQYQGLASLSFDSANNNLDSLSTYNFSLSNCSTAFIVNNINIFNAISPTILYKVTITNLTMNFNVQTATAAVGLSTVLSNAVITNLSMSGSLSSSNVRGLSSYFYGDCKLINLQFSLQLSGTDSSFALVNDMSNATSLQMSQISFSGYSNNQISFSYVRAQRCLTNSKTVGTDGMCYCADSFVLKENNGARTCA
ncbi:Hypothetical_protein [Hexamita inflata]|uniref:Hypothetical_protein n=1 Tax=Hexamita inflata TaxID=28002 RepID=A0AA86PVZ9_9EUKA|nr:Hypothetical protein HINF_LOCUS33506 [Hexamita inflata]